MFTLTPTASLDGNARRRWSRTCTFIINFSAFPVKLSLLIPSIVVPEICRACFWVQRSLQAVKRRLLAFLFCFVKANYLRALLLCKLLLYTVFVLCTRGKHWGITVGWQRSLHDNKVFVSLAWLRLEDTERAAFSTLIWKLALGRVNNRPTGPMPGLPPHCTLTN